MTGQSKDSPDKPVVRVDSPKLLEQTLQNIRGRQVTSKAAYVQSRESNSSHSLPDEPSQSGPPRQLPGTEDSRLTIPESTSLAERIRLLSDSNLDSLVVHNQHDEIVDVVTRQGLLEAMLAERELAQQIAHVGSFEFACDGSLRNGSEEYFRILGLPPSVQSNAIQDFGKDYFHPEDQPVWVEGVQSVIRESGRFECECRVLQPDDSQRWVHCRAEVSCADQSEDVSLHGTLLDITKRKQIELALVESNQNFQVIFESVPECVKLLDVEGHLLDMNAAGLKLIEADSLEQVRGESVYQLLAPEHLELFEANNKAVFRGESNSQEFEIIGLKGTRRWMETEQVPLRDSSGEITMLLAVTREITQRKQAVDALIVSEARNRAMLDGSPVCVKIVDMDSRLLYMSTAGQKQLKIDNIEPFYGQPFPPPLYPEPMRKLAIEHLERAKRGETTNTECCVLDTEGNKLWFDTTFAPDQDETGQVQYVIVTSVNITERKVVQSDLSSIFNTTLDLICVADLNTARFIKVNPSFQRVLGYSEEELLGRSFLDFIHPEDIESTLEVMDQSLKKGIQVLRFENRYRTKSGEYRVLEWTGNRNDRSRVAYSVAHDITERKQAEEDARFHQEALAHVSRVSTMGEMATGLAHELNQPLAAITSYSFAARMAAAQLGTESEEVQEILGKLEGQAIRAGSIVRKLRDLVKKAKPTRVYADLNRIVKEVTKFVEPDLRRADSSLVLMLVAEEPKVLVDEIQLQQVLVNLIRNALDSMEEIPINQRKVTISTQESTSGLVELRVSDVGRGLSSEELEQVFEAFYTTKREGMGMGLPISRSIIEAHGGKLWADSNSGPGATFGFAIPRASQPDEAVAFIIDNEAVMRDALEEVLSSMAISTKCFSTVRDFLIAVEQHDCDGPACVVADVQVPQSDGVDLFQQLRAREIDLPVILLTGNGTQSLPLPLNQLGVVAVLEKPFSTIDLQDAVTASLELEGTSDSAHELQ